MTDTKPDSLYERFLIEAMSNGHGPITISTKYPWVEQLCDLFEQELNTRDERIRQLDARTQSSALLGY